MNKRKLAIVLIGISIVCVIGILGYDMYEKRKNKPKFDTEQERIEYIENFVDRNTTPEPAENKNTENSGGYDNLQVKNISVFTDKFGIDKRIALEEKLVNSINHIEKLKELSTVDDNKIVSYFNDNKNNIMYLYGIDNSEEFIQFIKSTQFIGEGGISVAEVDTGSLIVSGDTALFKIKLISRDSEYIYNVKLVFNLNKELKNEVILYWSVK